MTNISGQTSTGDKPPRDILGWAALTAALVVTMSAEYQLARDAGFNPWLAAGVPASLDIYALRAMRLRRDVGLVVVAMIAVNAMSHLVTAGLLDVNIAFVVLVSAIAPLVFWRVHKLRHDTASERQETPAPAASAPRQVLPPPPPTNPTPVAKKAPAKPRQKPANSSAKKAAAPRRSMGEWVRLGEPVFHAEFQRLQRNPTGVEFADALAVAGHGRPSESNAKNIRNEIIGRTPLPSLGQP